MTAPANRVQEPPRSLARDVLACLSLANLCYLNVWLELTGTGLDYFRKAPPSGVNAAAAAINVGVLALACFALLTIYRRIRSPLLRRPGQVFFVLFLVVPLNVARKSVSELSVLTNLADALGPWGAQALFGVAALVVATVTFRRTATVTRIAVAALLMFSPLLPVFLAQALWTQWA